MGVSIDVAALAQHTLIGSHDDEVDVAALAAHTVHGASPSESWAAAVAMHSVRGGDAAALAVDLVVMHTVVAPDVFPPVDPVTGGIASQRITVSVDVSGRGGAAGSGGTSAGATQAGLDAEIASRVAADSAESSARAAADTAEATARAAADTAETAARIAADALKADITYVDAKVAGLSWKQAVRAATTVAGTLASSFANGSVIDGVTLATGDRILVKNQSTASENGIYIVAASGAPTRATDADAGAELVNATVFVSEGTTLADTQWTCSTNAPITVGSTLLAFAQLSGGGGGSGAGAWFDPFLAPTSPSATDDDWSSGGITGWTAVQWSTPTEMAAFDANTTKPGWLYASTNSAGSDRTHALLKAIPAGDFTIVLPVVWGGRNANFNHGGLMLADGTTSGAGQQRTCALGVDSGMTRISQSRNSFTGWNANIVIEGWNQAAGFVRMRRSGTTYFFAWSSDSRAWYEVSPVLGMTPTHFGIYTLNSSGVVSNMTFGPFRYSASATASFGGLRS